MFEKTITSNMKVLFLNLFKPTVNASGGIARVTGNLAKLFTQRGYACGVAYYNDSEGESDDCFETAVRLESGREEPVLKKLASSYQIFVIQIQMSKAYLHLVPLFEEIRHSFGTKVIYCHHNVPFTEAAGYDFNYLKYLLFYSQEQLSVRLKESIWCLTAMALPRYAKRRIASRRKYVADHVDKTVLLSESFIPSFREYVNCPDSKVTAIGNCVTFRDRLNPEELDNKEKTILVVSNMNERAKRISTILRIWCEVTCSGNHPDWKLVLIGNGPDLNYYKKLAARLKLRNYSFKGTCDPLPYYEKGSLLLLTSAYEGFGMVILEAQQMGCVPVVYDSYESVHDLITDGENGLLIENKNRKQFCSTLEHLMEHEEERRRIALNCINMDNRFSNDRIYSLWKNLFDSLVRENNESE